MSTTDFVAYFRKPRESYSLPRLEAINCDDTDDLPEHRRHLLQLRDVIEKHTHDGAISRKGVEAFLWKEGGSVRTPRAIVEILASALRPEESVLVPSWLLRGIHRDIEEGDQDCAAFMHWIWEHYGAPEGLRAMKDASSEYQHRKIYDGLSELGRTLLRNCEAQSSEPD